MKKKCKKMMRKIYTIMLTTILLVLLSGCGTDKVIDEAYGLAGVHDIEGTLKKLDSLDEVNLSEEQIAKIEAIFIELIRDTDSVESLDILEYGAKMMPSNEIIASEYTSKLREIVEYDNLGAAYDLALGYLEHAKELYPDNMEIDELLKEESELSEEMQPYVDTLVKAKSLIESASWQELADFSQSEEAIALSSYIGDEGSFYYASNGGDTGKAIACYSMKNCDCDEWYIGDIVSGKREGNGGWYWARTDVDGLYYENYTGAFLADKPNGLGENIIHVYDKDYVISGNFSDGLENGDMDIVYTDSDEIEYTGSYTANMGIVSEIETEYSTPTDGYYPYCVLESLDGKKAHIEKSTDTQLHAVAHYR